MIRTSESTRLEVGKVHAKYYACGVGLIKEVAGDGSEAFELISVTYARPNVSAPAGGSRGEGE